MYIQKKNNVWWLRENIGTNETGRRTANHNLGYNFIVAKKKIHEKVYEDIEKWRGSDGQIISSIAESRKNEYESIIAKMDEIEKANPTKFVNLKLTIKQYEKVKLHLPPDLRIF